MKQQHGKQGLGDPQPETHGDREEDQAEQCHVNYGVRLRIEGTPLPDQRHRFVRTDNGPCGQDRLPRIRVEKRHCRAENKEGQPLQKSVPVRKSGPLDEVQEGEERNDKAHGEGCMQVGPQDQEEQQAERRCCLSS